MGVSVRHLRCANSRTKALTGKTCFHDWQRMFRAGTSDCRQALNERMGEIAAMNLSNATRIGSSQIRGDASHKHYHERAP